MVLIFHPKQYRETVTKTRSFFHDHTSSKRKTDPLKKNRWKKTFHRNWISLFKLLCRRFLLKNDKKTQTREGKKTFLETFVLVNPIVFNFYLHTSCLLRKQGLPFHDMYPLGIEKEAEKDTWFWDKILILEPFQRLLRWTRLVLFIF